MPSMLLTVRRAKSRKREEGVGDKRVKGKNFKKR